MYNVYVYINIYLCCVGSETRPSECKQAEEATKNLGRPKPERQESNNRREAYFYWSPKDTVGEQHKMAQAKKERKNKAGWSWRCKPKEMNIKKKKKKKKDVSPSLTALCQH